MAGLATLTVAQHESYWKVRYEQAGKDLNTEDGAAVNEGEEGSHGSWNTGHRSACYWSEKAELAGK